MRPTRRRPEAQFRGHSPAFPLFKGELIARNIHPVTVCTVLRPTSANEAREQALSRTSPGGDGAPGGRLEREWINHELFALYARGWKAGAVSLGMDPSCKDLPEYDVGYNDGREAAQAAAKKAAKRLRYDPSVLRKGSS